MLLGWLILWGGRALRRGKRLMGVGWALVTVGGLWSVLAVRNALATVLLLTAAGQQGGPGLSPTVLLGLAGLVPPMTLLTAGILILRSRKGPQDG
jgi:hypothetical protein